MKGATTMTDSPELEVRNLRFRFDDDIPKHWHGASPVRTAFFNSQSLFFPAGERFFVDSVKRYIPRLRDPALYRRAQLFCGQEAVHQREHINYNCMLERQGYPAQRMERAVKRVLALVTLLTPARWRLAVTCALEHFTAIGANQALTDAGLFQGAEPRMAAFWRWHAGEETEHKSIPFDVYRAVGGNYFERVYIMLATTLIYQSYSLLHLLRFLWVDGCLFSPRAWRQAACSRNSRAGRSSALRDYFAYYRPSFHPAQLDSQVALAAFRSELAASQVYSAARA
jgi:uncharacterized protein